MNQDARSTPRSELSKLAADLESGKVVLALGNDYPDYPLHEMERTLAAYLKSALSETERNVSRPWRNLLLAAQELRQAQREYMANRGNDDLGKVVADKAKQLDVHIVACEIVSQ
jgi:hypothetical protein